MALTAGTAQDDSDHQNPEHHSLQLIHPPAMMRKNTMVGPSRPVMHKRSATVPIDQRIADFIIHPPPLSVEYWSDPPAEKFKIRSAGYLTDRVKCLSLPSVFKLLTVDLIQVQEPLLTGMCAQPKERIQMALAREAETGHKELPEFIFCVNYCVPGAPFFHWVAYFGTDHLAQLRDASTPLGRVCEPFFFGDDDLYRDNHFKLIPRIVEGNFVVKKAVGSKPSLLGRKLKQYYIRSERYMELIVDIGSDPVADRIVKLVSGYAKTLTVDMMFLVEGDDEATLPERILGGARMEHLDFKNMALQRKLMA